MALVTIQEVKDWVVGDGVTSVTGVNDAVLTACVAAAGEVIIDESTRIWEKAAGLVDTFDGDDAFGPSGELLVLRRFPVIYNVSTDPLTVSENGKTLAATAGYTTTADVVIKGVGIENKAVLIRRNVSAGPLPSLLGWAPGKQNVTVTYNAGFAAVPERIKFVAKELSWLMYQEGRKVGVDNVAQAGSSRALVHKLSALSQQILLDARRY